MSKKRILVTGGAGFLGSHLCELLVEQGHTVVCLDNFHTGSKKNLASLLTHPNFQLIEHDICHPFYFEVDQIYNLACPASPFHYQNDPIQTAKTSVFGIFHVLELAKKTKAKVLQASTSEVYGDPEVHPQQETYWGHVNPIGIRACYDEGKRCAETFCFDYHRIHGIPIKIARIFNTYGPRMHPGDGRVVSNLIVQSLQETSITIYGTGNQTRSFCYVSDLVRGLVALMESPDGYTGPVNLGNPCECTILELSQLILNLTKSSSKLHFLPLPSDDPQKRKPDISLAEHDLQWKPEISLQQGLRRTIQYFQSMTL